MDPSNLKGRPVFTIIALIILAIFLFDSRDFEKICGDQSLFNGFKRTFIHGNSQHIMSNLFAFYVLSRIEIQFGSAFFFGLILQILVLTVLFEAGLHYITKGNINCSVGWSGVLFGLAVWELVREKQADGVDGALILAIVAMVVSPSLENPQASLLGHALGAFSGFIVASLNNIFIR